MATRLLIISFSPLTRDARLLKQIALFAPIYEVTTCGFGPAPKGVADHVELTNQTFPSKIRDALLEAKAYSAAYWLNPLVRNAKKKLRSRSFDIILANDIDTLPLALALNPRLGVHADMHEFFPELEAHHAPWKRRVAPWYSWLCAVYLPLAKSVTTVGPRIAAEYTRRFKIPVEVVTNATPFYDLSPTAVTRPIRLVHSGTSHQERNLMALIDAVIQVEGFTLDLYLTPNDPPNLEAIRERTRHESRITVHDPVPYENLLHTLNTYDVGVHLLPPISFEFKYALPNKIFDFAQARLAAIVGPSPEMADIVTANGYGLVTQGFSATDLVETLENLTVTQVRVMKAAANAHAHTLSSETQVGVWEQALNTIAHEEPHAHNHHSGWTLKIFTSKRHGAAGKKPGQENAEDLHR